MDLQVDTSIEQSQDFTGAPGVNAPGMGAVASPSTAAVDSPSFTGLAAPQLSMAATSPDGGLPSLKRVSKVGKVRSQVVAFAKQFLGIPYVWGGNGPKGLTALA
jgi:cell wall-associated NlpC family hydrolase